MLIRSDAGKESARKQISSRTNVTIFLTTGSDANSSLLRSLWSPCEMAGEDRNVTSRLKPIMLFLSGWKYSSEKINIQRGNALQLHLTYHVVHARISRFGIDDF